MKARLKHFRGEQCILGQLTAFLLLASVCSAQTTTTTPAPHGSSPAGNDGRPCLVDVDRDLVPDCIQETGNGKLRIAPQYVTELHVDPSGLAPVWSEAPPKGWMYVNREGAILITGVPSADNWIDAFAEGLVRTVIGGKYGFANKDGTIVIKPAYDYALPFDQGYAGVCNHCREMCALSGEKMVEMQSVPGGCDHTMWVGGEWFKINKKGRIASRLHR